MKPESGINNRWALLEESIGIENLRHKFNAYGWYNGDHVRITKDEHWCGFWNDCFNFVTIFPKSFHGRAMITSIARAFAERGYTIEPVINGGISIAYETMTPDESRDKARRNLLGGGRMSD